jgi:hypothetical protein
MQQAARHDESGDDAATTLDDDRPLGGIGMDLSRAELSGAQLDIVKVSLVGATVTHWRP